MNDLSNNDLTSILEQLVREFFWVRSEPELIENTLKLTTDLLDADVFVIAEKENGCLNPLASRPAEWTDSDGLLSPTSLPSLATSRGISYLIADRADVRGAAGAESLPSSSTIDFRSVIIVPFGDENSLIVGRRDDRSFSEDDLDLLRIVGTFTTNLLSSIEAADSYPDDREWVEEAAAGLSHDAQNFLAVIEGRLELARENPHSEHFAAIERATHRLSELIEDTRTLLETGTHVTDFERVSLSEVVLNAWQIEQTTEADLITEPLAPVIADRSRLCQLFENLFRNAIEHAGPDVTVWVGMLEEGQGFYVDDDGPGIDPDERGSVMQFAYSTSEENTGLGLNIVQWIAAAHGWDVTIEDGELGGTRFEFTDVDGC